MNNQITADLFAALNIFVLERLNIGLFKVTGTVPDWLMHFYDDLITSGSEILIPPGDVPFLENFLIDAEESWLKGKSVLKSGIWNQVDLAGKEYYFEASALCVTNKKLLLIELLGEAYQEKHRQIQKARENKLNYQWLQKENQKKEVLIHCILHDVAGQLSSINYCFALLDLEHLTPKGKNYLEIGRKQTIQQEMLIREILDAFSADVKSLESFTSNADKAPDVLFCTRNVIQLLTPTFALNKMQLLLATKNDTTTDWKVVGDQSRLERVITNLAENAFRHSPPNSVVTIGLQQDEKYITVTIDDQGSGVPPEIAKTLFQKFSQGKDKSGKSGLGLYFCRITVERWGGAIGYLLRPQGGSQFWFRLPKAK